METNVAGLGSKIVKSPTGSQNETDDLQTKFLFDICKEVMQFYETPVIFLTKKDYSDMIFNTMCNIRKVFQGTTREDKTALIDSIVDFHLEWLHAVNEVENYVKAISTIPREEVYVAVSYTIDAMVTRLKYFKMYMQKNIPQLNNSQQANMAAEIEIVEDIHKEVTQMLLNKLKCLRNDAQDDIEFQLNVHNSAEDLLTWIDKIYDGLSILLSSFLNVNVPQLGGDLTKTLQEIVDELQASTSETALNLVEDLKRKGQQISTMIRGTTNRSIEISKVVEKINILDDRITRLENEPMSAALMALQNKKLFLEKRLESLQNLKTTIGKLNEATIRNFDEGIEEEEICVCEDFFRMRIFNHSLPLEERDRLVTALCNLWDLAVFGNKGDRSVISILSAAEMKEDFTDELGTFSYDAHGRKIYKVAGESTLYQVNERNELVPLADDADHIYFYDDCGRYFIDRKTRERVYKAHATASEYMMDSTGLLMKSKEVRDGVTYLYDSFGRYRIDEDGRHIYREEDAASEYENDGLGNLVRIRSQPDIFDLCPGGVNVTEDFQYLKFTVGNALKECIADCILRQPADPIKFLSTRLLKYRENLELREIMAREKEALEVERDFIREQERIAAEKAAMEAAQLHVGSEATSDSNMQQYTTFMDKAYDTLPTVTPPPSSVK